MADIHKAGGILIQNRKLLVERSQGRDVFLAPGGKIEAGESAEQALKRELKEEFDIDVQLENLEPFGSFIADAIGAPGKKIQMDVFVVTAWTGEPKASSEVEEIAWIGSKTQENLKLGSIIEHEILPRLKAAGQID